MANQYINVYKDNPTEGGVDGTLVSAGDMSSPIAVTLDTDNSEATTFKLAVRCVEGYRSVGDVVISGSGDRWSFSLAEDGSFADSIILPSAVDSVNTIFWARTACSASETASTDNTCHISVNASVRAADSTIVLMHFDDPDPLKDECGNFWGHLDDYFDLRYELDEETWESDTSQRCQGVWSGCILLSSDFIVPVENASGNINEQATVVLGGQDFTVEFWYRPWGEYSFQWDNEFGFELYTVIQEEMTAEDYHVKLMFQPQYRWLEFSGCYTTYDERFDDWYYEYVNEEEYVAWGKSYEEQESLTQDFRHYAVVYRHDQKQLLLFMSGRLIKTVNLDRAFGRENCHIVLGHLGDDNTHNESYVDEFRVVDGIAVWTEDFTPPTEPYSLPQNVNVEILCDTSITIVKEEADKDYICVVELYDIALRTGTVYVCNTDVDIMFEGHKYIAVPIEREDISRSVDDIDDDMKVTMADASVEQLQFIIAGFDFRGCQVRVRQIIYPDSILDNSIQRDCFYGYVDNPAYENGSFSCTLRSRIPKVTVPRRTFQAVCNCKFGDSICQMSLEKSKGTIVSVVADNQIVIQQNSADGYWNNGIITVDGESRMICKSEGNVITTFYPFFANISAGLVYSIQRGCDKTSSSCSNFNNLEHFSGFPSIPFENVYR